jgi:hypothetical protein
MQRHKDDTTDFIVADWIIVSLGTWSEGKVSSAVLVTAIAEACGLKKLLVPIGVIR